MWSSFLRNVSYINATTAAFKTPGYVTTPKPGDLKWEKDFCLSDIIEEEIKEALPPFSRVEQTTVNRSSLLMQNFHRH